ncbi:failed axon connections homolog isoform X1 [Babylonia areolata]|uniref:failed axon connections homolog isoform X1 n=2 Tax=Babylonia areolata TaxID=304850 RepID=UPI003FD45FD1
MEELRDIFDRHPTLFTFTGGLMVSSAGLVLYRWLRDRRAPDEDLKRQRYPPDTVILHDFGRSPYAPSAVPFTVKLATYLRMAKIPYQYGSGTKKSSKSKYPWITYNGEDIADSAFCISFLNRQRNVNLSSWMSPEQRAVAVAFQRLAEEDLYWVLLLTRWVTEVDEDFVERLLPFRFATLYVKLFITPRLWKMAWAQGMGRHSQEEVMQIARKDLTALSDYLGTKKFLMGDQPCEEDCAVFGQLSQIYWQLPGSVSAMFKAEFPRLVAYCERMKDTFWPDWVECTTQGGTVKATR